ncbi:hypothetical protein CEXT_207781 [Caerostris extrusa]|uniref:Uncharacterized protein n=1 Tax=Caerostris extrusa TaxID=172846 RepID=A0AAV4THE0_CAEEX|nr:hypothetical protein CEXT_207781 [Caerostris extrusa]
MSSHWKTNSPGPTYKGMIYGDGAFKYCGFLICSVSMHSLVSSASVEQCHLLEIARTASKKLRGGLPEERKQLSETERRADPADPTT